MRPLLVSLLLSSVACLDVSLPSRPGPPGPGTITGTLVRLEVGESQRRPVPNGVAVVVGSGLRATSDAEGRFVITGVSAPVKRLFVQGADGAGRPLLRVVDLATLRAEPGRDVALGEVLLSPPATVRGRVLRADEPSTSGHGGSLVVAPELPVSATTSDDGRFVLEGLPAGTLTLAFARTGYRPATLEASLTAQQELTLSTVTLDLDPGPSAMDGSLRGRVITSAGQPLPGANVTLTGPTPGTARSRDDGRFEFEGLVSGVFTVTVSSPGLATATLPNLIITTRRFDVGDVVLGALQPGDDGGVGGGPAGGGGATGGGAAGGGATGGGAAGGMAGGGAGGVAGGAAGGMAGGVAGGVAGGAAGGMAGGAAGGTAGGGAGGTAGGAAGGMAGGAAGGMAGGAAGGTAGGVPAMPPGAPTGVMAVAGNASASVTWVPPQEPLGSPPLTGFEVRVTPGGQLVAAGGASVRASVTGLTNNVPVTFAVRASNIAGPGPWSMESSPVTPMGGAAVVLLSGGGQSTLPLQLFGSPLRFELRNAQGQPVPSAALSFTADLGAVVTPDTVMTDAVGQATVTVRASRLVGLMGVTASVASGPSLTVQLTVSRPAPGTLIPLTNLLNNGSATFSTRAFELGIGTTLSSLWLAVARDGTFYLASQTCELLRVSREGVVSRVAGTSSSNCFMSAGDGMPAANARFDTILGLVLDEARQRLYVRTRSGGAFGTGQSRIRSVPLDGGLVTTLAGALSIAVTPGPGFGDDGEASQASIGGSGGMALSRDGRFLWFADQGAQRMRRIDLSPAAPLVTSVVSPCAPSTPTSFTGLDFNSPVATGPSGVVAFFASAARFDGCGSATATFLWAGVGGQPRPLSTGTSSVLLSAGANARDVRVPPGSVAFDEAGNLVFAADNTGIVYVIDGVTSVARVLTGAGTQTAGVGPASSFLLERSAGFGFDAEGTLYFLNTNGSQGGVVRALFDANRSQPTTVSLSATAGSGQQVRATDRAATMTASLSIGGMPVPNVRVDWTSDGGVAAFGMPATITNAQGTASNAPWMPRRARPVDVQAQVLGLLGNVVSSLSFPTQVLVPDAGVVSTLGNVVRSPTRALPVATGHAAIFGGFSGDNVDTDAAGVIYVSVGGGGGNGTDDFIVRIDLDGVTSLIQPPVANNSPMALAYHRARDRLYYVVQGSTDSSRIYEWTPPMGPSTLVAGGGARSVLDGDGANGTSAFIGSPTRIAAGPGNTLFIWDGQNSRIRVLDLTTGVIDAWVRFQAAFNVNCSPTVPFTTGFPQPKRFISFNAAGSAFVWAYACSAARMALVEVPPTGPAVVWATLPFVLDSSRPFDLFFEPSGDALYVDTAGARVFRIDAQTRTSTVILGTGSGSGDTPDWSPASMTGITPPTSLAPLPQGRFVVVTGETLRAVW